MRRLGENPQQKGKIEMAKGPIPIPRPMRPKRKGRTSDIVIGVIIAGLVITAALGAGAEAQGLYHFPTQSAAVTQQMEVAR